MKTLSFNTGYFLDYEGTRWDYLGEPWKSVIGSKNEKSHLDEFLELVKEVQPDAVLTQEIDGGSSRSLVKGQHNYLSERIGDALESDFQTKYRGRLFPRMPLFRFMGNMVFYK